MDVNITVDTAAVACACAQPAFVGQPSLKMTLLEFIASLGYNPADVEQVVGTPTTFTIWYRVPTADPGRYSLQSDGYYLQ